MQHPYKKFENTELWDSINCIIEDLVSNQDIQELTAREYIVGYFCEKILIINKVINK